MRFRKKLLQHTCWAPTWPELWSRKGPKRSPKRSQNETNIEISAEALSRTTFQGSIKCFDGGHARSRVPPPLGLNFRPKDPYLRSSTPIGFTSYVWRIDFFRSVKNVCSIITRHYERVLTRCEGRMSLPHVFQTSRTSKSIQQIL